MPVPPLAVAFALAGPPMRATRRCGGKQRLHLCLLPTPQRRPPWQQARFDINNQGVIVGNYDINDGNSTIYGYIQRGSSFTDVTVPGFSSVPGSFVDLYKINSGTGTVVGDYGIPPAFDTHGFSRDAAGKITFIDYPLAGVQLTTARGINDAGTIVGRYDDAAGVTHGFFLKNGIYSTYDLPGATVTALWFINNKGQFGGDYTTPDGVTHGLIVSGSTVTTVDIPGSTFTVIHDLNSSGIAVGIDVDPVTGLDDSFLFNLNTGQITPFAFPGSTDTDLYGINDAGVIAGTFDSFSVAFIATPVPEPSSLALLSLGGLALAGWRRWKKRATV